MWNMLDWTVLVVDIAVGLFIINRLTDLSSLTKRVLNCSFALGLGAWVLHSAGWLPPVSLAFNR
jgi:hypothetical protein